MAGLVLALLLAFQAPDAFEQGHKALEANQPDAAVPLLQQAVQAHPNEYSVHFELALALTLTGQDAQAIREYERTLELHPHLYQAELNNGILLVRASQFAAARMLLADAASQKPKDYKPQLFLGQAALGLNDLAAAGAAFQAALAADPASPDAELGLARALLGQGRLAEAAGHFEKAAAGPEGYRDAMVELAVAYEKAKQPAEAMAIYRSFPDKADAQSRLGELLLTADRPADAIEPLERSVRLSPKTANRAALAEAYRRAGRPEKELALAEAAVNAEPADFEFRMFYGRALRDRRKLPAAANQFFAAAKLKPDSVEAWNELAGVLIVNQDYAAGIGALDRIRALGKETAGDLYLRAITLDKLRQVKPALESYRQFLAMDGDKHPDQDFQARHRAALLEKELNQR